MSDSTQVPVSLRSGDIQIGDTVKSLELNLTATMIVAGAIATRDYMPVHHDKAYAISQGAPDIFMNILSTNAYVARFVTDWAGPETFVKKIDIRLGVPAVPNQTLRFTGEVLAKTDTDDGCDVQVSVTAANDTGNHATGTVLLSVPA